MIICLQSVSSLYQPLDTDAIMTQVSPICFQDIADGPMQTLHWYQNKYSIQSSVPNIQFPWQCLKINSLFLVPSKQAYLPKDWKQCELPTLSHYCRHLHTQTSFPQRITLWDKDESINWKSCSSKPFTSTNSRYVSSSSILNCTSHVLWRPKFSSILQDPLKRCCHSPRTIQQMTRKPRITKESTLCTIDDCLQCASGSLAPSKQYTGCAHK